ncbi:hypothetical protein GCM10008179_32320 [Hansschlegelia plantiphila]|uniref:DUF2497 domain-containing protein n=2 Tax=Hansschlegelia plantiphila TaxID=374655 RepID=A0A9W6MWJ5_9HYPH|nr:DUF2497 domain-containing protein [Hansschlegelia plantiphila]GLK69594.1 hypothetical protein GCM10008179_32320 [Hansschlegelia plantiphila]
MSTAAKAHEPTMEEILASIRRIISDDEPGQSMAAPKPSLAKPAAAPASEPEAPEAVAEEALGQDDIDAMFASFDAPAPKDEAKPALTPPASRSAASQAPDDLDVFELTEDMADEPLAAPQPAPAQPVPPSPVRAAAPASAFDERLLSSATDDVVTNAFGSLANTILTNNARTLDDIVKEMLRPMLRSWLDDNLPPLVERLVRHEIERVARGGR